MFSCKGNAHYGWSIMVLRVLLNMEQFLRGILYVHSRRSKYLILQPGSVDENVALYVPPFTIPNCAEDNRDVRIA